MSPRRNGEGPERGLDLTIWGISDPELLGIVDDLADEEGWTRSYDVRIQLGENPEAVKNRSGVGQRLAWMKRYGWLERNDDDGRWRLTPVGQELLDHPDLTKAVEQALGKMNSAQRLRLTRELAESGAARPEFRTALRRQWTRSLGR
jgi:hypothetical protein